MSYVMVLRIVIVQYNIVTPFEMSSAQKLPKLLLVGILKQKYN